MTQVRKSFSLSLPQRESLPLLLEQAPIDEADAALLRELIRGVRASHVSLPVASRCLHHVPL